MKPIAIVVLAISLSSAAQTINPTPIRGNAVVQNPTSGSQAIAGDVSLNFHKITNSLNYFNYVYSSNTVQPPAPTTGRTWANPEFYYAVNDTSAATSNPFPMADLHMTPLLHIESFNGSPNDSSPIYVRHTCSYSTGPVAANGGCVGIVVAATDTPTSEHGVMEAVNCILRVSATDPLVEAQGIEMNMFNDSGVDSLLQANTTFTRGPYFGISATAGGSNKMVAGFHSGDQGGTGGWQYGAWFERGSDANLLLGYPGGGAGSQDAIQVSTVHGATAGSNSASMPIDFRTSYWNGTTSSPFATIIKAMPLDNSTNPVQCLNVAFTAPGGVTNICNDGSIRVRNISWRTFNGAPSGNCNPGDFATNASPVSANTVLYVCFPANVWNPK